MPSEEPVQKLRGEDVMGRHIAGQYNSCQRNYCFRNDIAFTARGSGGCLQHQFKHGLAAEKRQDQQCHRH